MSRRSMKLDRAAACAADHRTKEVYTVGYDPDLAGFGSGPGKGNPFANHLTIPDAPTTDGTKDAYTFILAAESVPTGRRVRIRNYTQLLVLQARPQADDGSVVPQNLTVTSPSWHFIDGRVTWSLRFIPGIRKTFVPQGRIKANRGPSKSTNPYVAAPALLYRDVVSGRYDSPMGGTFPGVDLIQPGTMYDLRNPYQGITQNLLDIPVEGPGDIVFMASVWQTNPSARPLPLLSAAQAAVLGPEDQFVFRFPTTARYRYIGARLLLETA